MSPAPTRAPRMVQRAGSHVAHYVRPGMAVAFCYMPVPGFGAWPAPTPGIPVCTPCARRVDAQAAR